MPRLTESFASAPAVVAIPVRDEVERIADCLLALARQEGRAPGVLLLVNNTVDATMSVVAELSAAVEMPVVAIEHRFADGEASAGAARRLAMAHSDRLAPPGVPLLTTDADGRVGPDWLSANLYHLDRGIDAVFGRAVIDPDEALRIPPALHRADAQENAYAMALDELAHWLDPDPDDPWPRHTEHSGASIAVRRLAYREAGGVPDLALGEDRAFAMALRRSGARIRHAPEVQVVVSGRILGRAVGGMADTIRRRLVAPDVLLDQGLEPVAGRVRRIRMGRAVRRAWAAGRTRQLSRLAHLAGVAPSRVLACRGAAEAVVLIDGALPSARVPVTELAVQMAAAERVLRRLRVRAAAAPALV